MNSLQEFPLLMCHYIKLGMGLHSITRIFSHTFATCDTIFVELSLFNAPEFDNDTSMWSVPATPSPSGTTITSIMDISQPLVVAREDDNDTLWFLTYH